MGKKKISIWSEAIDKKNLEADKQREASEFFSDIEKDKKAKREKNKSEDESNFELDGTFVQPKKETVYVDRDKEVLVYTSKKPIKNTEGRAKLRNEREILAADIHGDEKEYKKWGWIGLIFTAFLLTIIIVPILLMFMGGALFIDSLVTTREEIGYVLDETEFAVKHSESGLYLQNPTYQEEQLILGEGYVNTFKFSAGNYIESEEEQETDKGLIGKDAYWLKSEMIFDGREMRLNFLDGKPVWSSGKQEDSVINIKRKKEGVNEFAINLVESETFIAKDDESNRIVLSRTPDYFTFEANIVPYVVKNEEEYLSDYNLLNDIPKNDAYIKDLTLNEEGNSLSIKSIETNKYINSYVPINHSDLPTYVNKRDSYKESLVLSNHSDTNLFIKTDPDGKMYLSSYQTLPFELFVTSKFQRYYPILTPNVDGTLEMVSYDLGTEESRLFDKVDKCNFWLVPNPNNLREKAIFFPHTFSFLDTKGGTLSLKKITEIEHYSEIDYLELSHSEIKNPEVTEQSTRVGFIISGLKANIVLKTHSKAIDGFEFYGFGGYESKEEAIANPNGYTTTVREYSNANRKGRGKIRLRHLEPKTWYQGIVATYRKTESASGKHVTFIYIPPFETGDRWHLPDTDFHWPDGWPNIDWPSILPPDVDLIDPGDPIGGGGEGEAATAKIWDSTDQEGPDMVIDIDEDEMLESASNMIEISTTFNQGTEDGEATGLGVKLEEVNEFGDPIYGGYKKTMMLSNDPQDGETYTTVFTGLTPETKYKATLVFYDNRFGFLQDQEPGSLKLDEGDTQMWATTERVAPVPVYDGSGVNWSDSGLTVSGTINNLRPTDEIMVGLTNETNDEFVSTGWIKASDWGKTSVSGWTFSVNELGPKGPFYEATYLDAFALDTYQANMWVRMDVDNDFKGWDEYSPAFDINYSIVSGDDSFFDVVAILEEKNISYV